MSPIVPKSICRAVFLAWVILAVVHGAVAQDGTDSKPAPARAAVSTDTSRPPDEEIAAVQARAKAGTATAADLIRLGYLYVEKGSFEDAMRSFDAALQQNPRSHEAKTGRGVVLARQGHLKEAEEALKDALILNPNPVRTHYELGLVYAKAGDLEKAIAEFKDGIKKHEQGR